MAKCYAAQIPSRFDSASRLWVPSINLDPARKFGDLVVCLPPNANRLHADALVAALKERMAEFSSDDYIIAVGDPALIAAAACIAAKATGGLLRVLKWDRMMSAYILSEVTI